MEDNSALYDLISNIQAKLNNDNSEDTSSDTSTNQNINSNNDKSYSSNINNNFNENTSNSNASSNNNFDFSNLDINTILKMQNLFSKFNRNTPKKNLLYSLKPFLNQTRQDRLGEYITILSVMDALDLFNKKGSDN